MSTMQQHRLLRWYARWRGARPGFGGQNTLYPRRAIPPLQHWWWMLVALGLLLYWQLPIGGTVIISSTPLEFDPQWPQITVAPTAPQPGTKVTVTVADHTPWTYVRLTVNGSPATFETVGARPGGATWQWSWSFTMPATDPTPGSRMSPTTGSGTVLEFYHDCNTGCRLRGRRLLEPLLAAQQSLPAPGGPPTKLCVAFPDPARNWQGRSGWVVDLTYAQLTDDQVDRYWTIDELAQRIAMAAAKGLRILVRVDYAKSQSLPPANDALALNHYLAYLRRLARDERLRPVYGYIIGSGYNTDEANGQAPTNPVTPEWYALLFNGYSKPVDRHDNVLATVRAENPQVRILVGPVRPWQRDQDGAQTYAIDAPWLNYMHTLAAALDAGAQAKAAAGIPLAAPDGFAVNAAGNPSAPELGAHDPAAEPTIDLPRAAWHGAQAGFRVYRDWLAIINSYPTTRGLPLYINAANTSAIDGNATPDANNAHQPAQNYPAGWLTNALTTINQEPQVQALCWFLDLTPGDDRWDAFSLSRRTGRLMDAAEEFERLLAK